LTPEGGGGLTFARIIKSADQFVASSTTLEDDDELTVALSANRRYWVICAMFYVSNQTADWKYAFSLPGSLDSIRGIDSILRGTGQIAGLTVDWSVVEVANLSDVNEHHNIMMGYVVTGGTAGNLILQYAQNVSDPVETTLKAGSTLIVWEQ